MPLAFYDRDGVRISYEHWLALSNSGDYTAAAVYARGGFEIITAWVGIGKPMHTVVMSSAEGVVWLHDWRNQKDASACHEALCRAMENHVDLAIATAAICLGHSSILAN